MKKWLLIQLNWKDVKKAGSIHNVHGKKRKMFDVYSKLEAYIDVLKDMRKMGEISKDIGFMVVELDE